MSSRQFLTRLKAIREQLPDLSAPACSSHGWVCAGSEVFDEIAVVHDLRHGGDFAALPCQPGDPADAELRLRQCGVLTNATPRGLLIYLICLEGPEVFDLEAALT